MGSNTENVEERPSGTPFSPIKGLENTAFQPWPSHCMPGNMLLSESRAVVENVVELWEARARPEGSAKPIASANRMGQWDLMLLSTGGKGDGRKGRKLLVKLPAASQQQPPNPRCKFATLLAFGALLRLVFFNRKPLITCHRGPLLSHYQPLSHRATH